MSELGGVVSVPNLPVPTGPAPGAPTRASAAESIEEYGRVAYKTYSQTVNGKSVRGEALPVWDKQTEALRTAWIAAANAAVDTFARDRAGLNR